MKTIKNWLEELPTGIREKALFNYSTEAPEKEEDNYIVMSEALSAAFVWMGTPEKHNFWQALFNLYRLKEL